MAKPKAKPAALPELPAERRVRHLEARLKESALKDLLKQQKKFGNSYKGGVPSRTSERWEPLDGSRFGSIGEQSQILDARGRAYQAYDNNPVARTLVQTETDNVIGDGLNYQPSSDSPEWNREAKDKYYEWIEDCSVRGADVHSGCELQRLIWDRSRVAGDCGWILVSRGDDSFIQVVQAENIVTPDGRFGEPGIRDGIKFDAWGKPVEFYVMTRDDQSALRKFTTVVARDFVWMPHMTKVNQSRPPSCFITIFDLLSHLDRYVDGVSLAAWMATVFGIIFKDSNATRQVQGLPYLTNSQGVQQRAVTLENGQVRFTAPDGEVVQVDAKQPMQQTPEFIRTMLRMLGHPFDMPLEVIAKDMSTCNFASARIGLLPFYRSCRIKAARFASRWSRTIRWWLSREHNRASSDPKRWKSAWPENYWNHQLLVNAWDYTDPVSEAQSDLLQISMRTKSRQMVISERGRDHEQIDREFGEDGEPEVLSTLTRDLTPEPVATQPENTQAPNGDVLKLYEDLKALLKGSVQGLSDKIDEMAAATRDRIDKLRSEVDKKSSEENKRVMESMESLERRTQDENDRILSAFKKESAVLRECWESDLGKVTDRLDHSESDRHRQHSEIRDEIERRDEESKRRDRAAHDRMDGAFDLLEKTRKAMAEIHNRGKLAEGNGRLD